MQQQQTQTLSPNNNNKQGMMACGHVYNSQTKTGIELVNLATTKPATSTRAKLWQTGQLLAEASVELPPASASTSTSASASTSTTKWDFWYNLEFARVFPQVSHWWFGSAWTQRVRVSAPTGILDDDTVTGLMQFVDDEQPGTLWTMTPSDPVLIYTPMPTFDVNPLNLPLRLRLAELVIAMLEGDIKSDEWQLVTSLVHRDELEARLPTDPAGTSTDTTSGRNWHLDDPRFELNPSVREVFCTLQGLHPTP